MAALSISWRSVSVWIVLSTAIDHQSNDALMWRFGWMTMPAQRYYLGSSRPHQMPSR